MSAEIFRMKRTNNYFQIHRYIHKMQVLGVFNKCYEEKFMCSKHLHVTESGIHKLTCFLNGCSILILVSIK